MKQDSSNSILIINDKPDRLGLICASLKQAGYEVETAGDARRGLELACHISPALIICQVNMQHISCLELCRRLRAEPALSSIPLMLVSHDGVDEARSTELLRAGADDYLEASGDALQLVAKATRLIERKRAEEALKRCDERWLSLIDNLSDIISIISIDGTTLYESPSVERVLGYRPEELIGRNIFGFIHPSDRPGAIATFRHAVEDDGRRPRLQYRFQHKDGSWRVLESVGKRFIDESGRVAGIVNSRDITARKLSEDALRASEEKYRQIVETANEGIWIIDAEGKTRFANRRMAEMIGTSVDEVLGRPVVDFVFEEDIAEVNKRLEEGRAGDSSQHEFYVRRKDGTPIYALYKTSPLIDQSGDVTGLLAMVSDITQRKRAEESIRFQASALAQVNEAVIAIDTEKRITYWNRGAERLYGFSEKEALGRPLEEINHYQWDSPESEQAALHSLNTTGTWHGENIHCNRNGEKIFVESSVSLLRNESGNLIGSLAVIRDINKRKLAQKALRENQKLFQSAFDYAAIGMALVSPEGKWLRVNRSLCNIVGYSEQELLATNFQAITHPDDLDADLEYVHRMLGGEISFYQMEKRYRHKQGHMVWVLLSVSLVMDAHGNPQYFISQIQDVTERKRAVEALSESENRLRAIVETEPECVKLIGKGDTLLEMNPAGLTMIEADSLAQAQGYSILSIVAPEYRKAFSSLTRRVLSGESGKLEFRIIGLKGTERWLETNAVPLRNAHKQIVAALSITRDITERKRAEEELRQSESQLAEAQRVAHVGSWNWELSSNIITWSDELYRIYGFKPREIEPDYETLIAMIHPEDRNSALEIIEHAIRTREPINHHFRIHKPGGEVRVLHARGNIASDEEGNPRSAFGTVQDVTERVRAEERLKNSNRKLRALAARLQSVREEESIRIAREIHDELGGAMTGLKIDLAWLKKRIPDSCNQAIPQKMASMNEIIDTTIRTIRHLSSELRPSILDDLGLAAAIEWQAREFESRTEIECHLVSLQEDVSLGTERATAIFRIFQEILTNVARHARATLVEIFMEEHDGYLILKVMDNGIGINESDITETRSLGLLGMRERALVFRGEIDITGVKGKGTTVTVRVPLE